MSVRRAFTPNRLLIAVTVLAFTVLGVAPANSAEHAFGLALTTIRVVPGDRCGARACGLARICHRVQTDSSAATSFPPRYAVRSTVQAHSYPAPDPRTPRRSVPPACGALAPGISSPIYLATLRLRI